MKYRLKYPVITCGVIHPDLAMVSVRDKESSTGISPDGLFPESPGGRSKLQNFFKKVLRDLLDERCGYIIESEYVKLQIERRNPMKIRIYTDYACPFCMIQKEMIKSSEAELEKAAGESIELESVFMEIHPEVPEDGGRASEILPADYVASINGKLTHYGEPYGLKPALNTLMSNSRRAQTVRGFLKFKQSMLNNFKALGMNPGRDAMYDNKVSEFDEAVYRAYNMEGRNIGDYEVLDAVLRSIGIDYSSREMCMDRNARDIYEADKKECEKKGIHITPTLEINGNLYPGLNKPEKLVKILSE